MRGVLLGLDYANRHVFNRDNLAGVRTIHFARWVPVDDGRRLIFASSYDGTLESYMDDFIDRLSWGLNAVFSNGMGYPVDPLADPRRREGRDRVQELPAQPPDRDAGLVLRLRHAPRPQRRRQQPAAQDLPPTLEERAADEWMALL